MPEERSEARGGSEAFHTERREINPLFPQNLRPSGILLRPYIPNPDVYNIAYPGGADLPHHGVSHGEETVILAAVLANVAYEDVKDRLGEDRADAFRKALNEPVLYYASGYHDCGRISDWRILQGEMKQHGPRGGIVIRDNPDMIDPNQSEENIIHMADLVTRHHDKQEGESLKDLLLGKIRGRSRSIAEGKVARLKPFEEYDPQELRLLILQEADRLGTPRGYYSRRPESPELTRFAKVVSSARVVKSHIPIVRHKSGALDSHFRFPQTTVLGLPQIADDLTWTTRQDPVIDRQFANVPHRSGAALAAGERINLITP